MTTKLAKQRLFLMDNIKLLASFCVVFIHCNFPGKYGIVIKAISRFAVPFFFLCSGCFLYNNSHQRILKKAGHILFIFFLSTLIYILFDIAHLVVHQNIAAIPTYFLRYTDPKAIRRFFLFNVPVIDVHLWYLYAMFYVYCMFYLIKRLHLPDLFIGITSVFLLILHMLIWQYFSYWNPMQQTYIVRNFLFVGFPMTGIGYILRKHQSKLPSFKKSISILILAMGCILSVLSRFFLGDKSLPLGAVIVSVTLIILCLTKKQPQRTLLKNAETHSTLIYLFHPLIQEYYFLFISKANITNPFFSDLAPIFVCILSVVFSSFCMKLQKVVKH